MREPKGLSSHKKKPQESSKPWQFGRSTDLGAYRARGSSKKFKAIRRAKKVYLKKQAIKSKNPYKFELTLMVIREEENYMDNQSNFVNLSIEENFRTIKIQVRKDDEEVIKKLEDVNDINDYILSLIRMDIKAPRSYHSIDDSVKIDFPVSRTMQDLIDKAERADLNDDYPVYMNYADAIDSQGKLEATRHQITDGQWITLQRRYLL